MICRSHLDLCEAVFIGDEARVRFSVEQRVVGRKASGRIEAFDGDRAGFLGEYEIRAMPGPKHAALIHIQDGTVPNAKPFLVDLTDNGADLRPDTNGAQPTLPSHL